MRKIPIIVFALIALTASAFMLTPFPGYDVVEKYSPEIFVAACVSNPPALFHPGPDDVNTYFNRTWNSPFGSPALARGHQPAARNYGVVAVKVLPAAAQIICAT